MRVKQIDKLMQTVNLVHIEVSPVRVQTDVIVPVIPVVVEGASMASYINIAIQALVEVATSAPVGPVPLAIEVRALVVHGVFCQQLEVNILCKVWRLRLGTSERVLGVH